MKKIFFILILCVTTQNYGFLNKIINVNNTSIITKIQNLLLKKSLRATHVLTQNIKNSDQQPSSTNNPSVPTNNTQDLSIYSEEDCEKLKLILRNNDLFELDIFLKNHDINKKDKNGNTALHHAVLLKNYEMTKELIERGADTTQQDNDGQVPVLVAFRKHINDKDDLKLLSILLINKDGSDIKDKNGFSVKNTNWSSDIITNEFIRKNKLYLTAGLVIVTTIGLIVWRLSQNP